LLLKNKTILDNTGSRIKNGLSEFFHKTAGSKLILGMCGLNPSLLILFRNIGSNSHIKAMLQPKLVMCLLNFSQSATEKYGYKLICENYSQIGF